LLPEVTIPETARERAIALAQLTAVGRAPVPRDGYTKLVRVLPAPEGPARLTGQLLKLMRGLCASRGKREPGEAELATVAHGARDSIPAMRLRVWDALRARGLTHQELSGKVYLPPSTASYLLQDLTLLGVTSHQGGVYALTGHYRDLADSAGFFG